MQENKVVAEKQGSQDILCIHSLTPSTCTFCKRSAASRRIPSSSYNRTTPNQLSAIIRLAHLKQRSLPANIRSWSVSFASQYLKMLLDLPFPREQLSRDEQFFKEHRSASDIYSSSHTTRAVSYLFQDGMTRLINKSIQLGDSEDLVSGISEVSHD